MRKKFSYLTLIATIAIITLSFSNSATAPPLMPIGSTSQLYPFESSPSAIQAGSRAITNVGNAHDGDTSTATAAIDFTPGFVGFESFSKPSDTGGTDFTIGYVDFKMRYTSLGSVDDEYRIVYYVGTSGPVVLKDWHGGTSGLCLMTMTSDTLAQTWGNQSEPEDGTWTWAEISSIKFRLETRAVGPPDLPPFLYTTTIYEVWISVYPTAPPMASTTVSVMPTQVESLGLYDIMFVDLYVTNVTTLQLYEAEISFDSTALYAYEAWTYWPFITKFYMDLTVAGVAKISYYIDPGIPYDGGALTDVGWNGTYPLARIYFYAMSAGPTWMIYDLTKLIAPGGGYLPHADWDGVYGTPPVGESLIRWKSTSEFDFTDPICTYWYEIMPDPGREWHLTSHEDNQVIPPPDGELNPSDQIDMMEEPPGAELWWFHVDEVGLTVHDPSVPTGEDPYSVYMILTFKETEPVPEFPLGLGLMMILALLIPTAYLWRLRKKVPKQ